MFENEVEAANFNVLMQEISLDTQHRMNRRREVIQAYLHAHGSLRTDPPPKISITLPIPQTQHRYHDPSTCRMGPRCPLHHVNVTYDDTKNVQSTNTSKGGKMYWISSSNGLGPSSSQLQPEGTSNTQLGAALNTYHEQCREYLISTFRRHAPHRLKEVEHLMQRHEDKLEDLLDAIDTQYNSDDHPDGPPENNSTDTFVRNALVKYFTKVAPKKS
eukprot:PhF_6_TR27015/c0_g1_i1/m.39458